MLISLQSLVNTFNLKINGVIHVGAHFGQEYSAYAELDIKDVIFIEPCKNAFRELQFNMLGKGGVICVNKAAGTEKGSAVMYVETANSGMSNSLLKPDKHLQQYPDIRFHSTEEVEVDTLDNIMDTIAYKKYIQGTHNMLVMDVQGFEHKVLKGATETLKNVDYIYTEVNRAELYKGCAMVTDLDAYLTEFTRAETNWGGKTWGDALYIRKSLMVKTV